MIKYRKKPNLRTETVGGGLAVLDTGRNKPYILNATSALVFRHCDGETTPEQLAELLHVRLNVSSSQARELVWMSLAELDKHDLLEAGFVPTQAPQRLRSRREAMNLFSAAGMSIALLPFILPMNARADVATSTAWTTTTSTEQWTTTTSTEYTGFTFSGWFPPVENPLVVNRVTAGRSVPMRFSLEGNRGLDVIENGYPVSQPITGVDAMPTNEVAETTNGAGLSYHAGSDRYTFLWKTNKAWAGTSRMFRLRLTDGTERFAPPWMAWMK